MSDEVIRFYIAEEIQRFYNAETKCCKKLYGLFATEYRDHIKIITNMLHLNIHLSQYNGHDAIIIFKNNCIHLQNSGMKCDLSLTPETIKDLYTLNYNSDYQNSEEEIKMSNEFLCTHKSLPIVACHKFFGNQKKVITNFNAVAYRNFAKDCFINTDKLHLMDALERTRVLIISGERKFDKALAISMLIMEKCSTEKIPHKILLVEKDDMFAIYNSERLSRYFNEKVGETIAFQIQLQSRVGDSSSLISTTSEFLLRVLMSETMLKCFQHITHVIVVGVHLHYAYTDLLLRELKVALKHHSHLKVILLSDYINNNIFLNYFGEAEVFNIDDYISHPTTSNSKLLYIEDIYQLLPEKRPVKLMANKSSATEHKIINSLILDKCLEAYEKSPTNYNFDSIIYMIKGESASINYCHSKTGRTVILLAALSDKIEHLNLLLKLQADPFIVDSNNMNAIKAAASKGNTACYNLLNTFDKTKEFKEISNIYYIDYGLIIDIIYMITTNPKHWQLGDIIIILPSYECLIHIKYYIQNQKLLGNLPEAIIVHLLYQGIEKEDLDLMLSDTRNGNIMKIILATDVTESLQCLRNIQYVIDSGRFERCYYNQLSGSKENIYNWLGKRRWERRRHLIDSINDGICFRLIRQDMFNNLPEDNEPDLQIIYLDRICLTIKLLLSSSNRTIIEYFQETIVQPQMSRILHSIEYLQKIGILSEMQEVTWLGCRLIDVPIDCNLGKLLVFSILMQCLDPILTIVSFMGTIDPFNLNYDLILGVNKDSLRDKLKLRKLSLAEGITSDHFPYLRLYQEWQNRLQTTNSYHQYMMNGLLEYVSLKRTHLLKTLRSSQLIHNKGNLNMHHINIKSNCWPIVKAVLVAGMYPNLCVIDKKCKRLKSLQQRELVLHPDSILRENDLYTLHNIYDGFNSTWMVYNDMSDSWHCNSIKFCTLVTPITVALFSGPMKISPTNIQQLSSIWDNSERIDVNLYIDEWVTFKTDIRQALLLLKTRQYFYSIYNNYLQYCSSTNTNQNIAANLLARNDHLFESIEKILRQEDKALNFVQPINAGLRPKVLLHKFSAIPESATLNTITAHIKQQNNKTVLQQKEFYMVQLNQMNSNLYSSTTCQWLPLLTDLIRQKTDKGELKIFIITYSRNPRNRLLNVLLGKWRNDELNLMECYEGNILIQNIMPLLVNTATNKQAALDAVISRGIVNKPYQIDNYLGELLVNLFAFNIDDLVK